MAKKWASLLFLLQLYCCFSCGSSGKVLVWPMEYSHWINLKTILDELTERGHEVTVLTSSASILVDPSKQSAVKFEVFTTSFTKDKLDSIFMTLIKMWTYELPKSSLWAYGSRMQETYYEYSDTVQKLCEDAVSNKKLMKKLQEIGFDVVLGDAIAPCSELLSAILNIPLVYTLRYTTGNTYEKLCGKLPLPPSYVPVVISELSDKMTFMERVTNMLYFLYFDFAFETFNKKKWDRFFTEVLGRPTTLCELMGKADIWLIRTYWDFEFPHPYLPNFEYVGGLQCKPAKPLPKEMEEFVQSSGEDGIVVFSLGSMVETLPEERSNMIASTLAQLPQKVIWRFDGKKPATLGPNTRLFKWIPQNDLLGHPKTKVFVTHGGGNGIYEAIYHGVPMVGLPMFVDQPDNIAHMEVKGTAVRLDLNTMTNTDFLNALKTVINDPSYKENAMKLSRIHHDQPVKPLDRAVFWIEFVMRHKGAKHLRPAAHDLTWVQYHSLDVIGFLLACVAATVYIITASCLFCFRKCTKSGKRKKND
ncbi:UDP-glucuronosyltransferase 2B17-like isoform X1 [Erinaceus europaeus]|uniref:UDP-glucuronosyltransferase n=2 Tax=Erinaceus europaeus TaxID=9365 RepID=A0A1S2ZRU3_ERIEU|nr:UDP-glucuronosyltransferase 2B17-like isoform X1 [Erinaceus europaeus]